MAKKPPKVEEDDSPKAKQRESDKKLLLELQENVKKCREHDKDNRDKYRANMKFALVRGEQWDETTKTDRGKDRPMYEFNEIRIKGKAIVNQIRANRPSAKISPAENGDVALAEAMKAEIDQIQNANDADAVQDYMAHHQVFGGMGAERYLTAWKEDSADKQDILIEPVLNPMCLYPDYACKKQDKSDARFWILESKMAKAVFNTTYPGAEPVDFATDEDFDDDCDDDHVWICEYWKKKPVTRKLALLSDGKTVDMATIEALPPGVTIVKRRNAPGFQIVQYICSGDAVLSSEEISQETGELEMVREHLWAGAHFPFNIAYGEYTVIDGKVHWSGITEDGKDAQRALNWAGTSFFEAIASTPQGTTWVTAEQAKGHVNDWVEAIRKNIQIKVFNPDVKQPGPPKQDPPASIPTALVAAVQMAQDMLKSSLGMPDATLGEKAGENSGIAIKRRQEAGAVANYNYGDNILNAMKRRYQILIDLIPKVKDTAYTLRVIGKDGAEKYLKINDIDPATGQKINDLSSIKYDLVVTQGPNYATQRQEAAETYMGLSQANPGLMAVAGDLIVGSLDLPKAQEISERLKATLPAQITAMLNKDNPVDPQVAAAMQEVELAAAQVQEQGQLAQQASAEAQAEQSTALKAKTDVAVAAANLKVQEAELATAVAEFKQLIAESQAKLIQQQSQDAQEKGDGDKVKQEAETAALVDGVAQALQSIQEQAAQVLQAQQQQIQQIAELATKPPVAKQAVSKRVNGDIHTVVTDADGNQQVAVSKRVGGGFETTIQPGTVQ